MSVCIRRSSQVVPVKETLRSTWTGCLPFVRQAPRIFLASASAVATFNGRPPTRASQAGAARLAGCWFQRMGERFRKTTSQQLSLPFSAASSSCGLQPANTPVSDPDPHPSIPLRSNKTMRRRLQWCSSLPARRTPVETAVNIMHLPPTQWTFLKSMLSNVPHPHPPAGTTHLSIVRTNR